MRLGFEGSQDHDFWLRASERASKISHIPQILYHWRVLPGSTAASGDCKPASFEAGRRAVEEAFHRRGINCPVKQSDWAAKNACSIFEPIMPDDGPSVAILIPTRNHAKRLKTLIDSLKKTTYKNYHIYIIDNESDDPTTLQYLASLPHRVFRIANPGDTFSYAAINNEAVRRVNEDLVLFLNDDIEVINPRWLSQMVGWSRLPGVGAVGARLLFPDRRIQHAGIVHGFNDGLAGHAYRLLPWWDPGSLNLARVSRDCLAVTAACMLTPRTLFLEIGGFDEVQFAVAYNDADYGYRLADAGYRCVYCAEAELYHHEGLSRGFQDNPREAANYRKVHGERVDPYVNPHLDPRDEAFVTKPTVVPISRSKSPIPVLGFTHNLNAEGAPRFEFELLARLKERGAIAPTVLSPCDGHLRESYEQAGIEVMIDPTLGGVAPSAEVYRGLIERLAETIRRGGFEVVHANTLQAFWAVDAARLAGIPSIWSIHESEPWQSYYDGLPPDNAASALACMTYPYRVVFTAKSTAEVWGDLGTSRNFELIHFALDAPQFQAELAAVDREEARRRLGLDPRTLGVLLVGTICDRKGQQDLARAFHKLSAEAASRMKCLIVGAPGEPGYAKELRSIVASLPADRRDRIEIVHGVKDTSSYWAAADLFCCTSRIESYPRVVLEAMAAGLPLVTTPVFGISEQVRDGVNALIYRPGDIQTLTRHLATLATDEAMRRSFASNAPWVLRGLPDPSRMDRLYLQTFLAAAESAAPAIADPRSTGGRGRLASPTHGPHLAERSPSQSVVSGGRAGA
jgi:GT2 family glycosyltransferase/glycosyltransferase involved in cell wall biosynthesis